MQISVRLDSVTTNNNIQLWTVLRVACLVLTDEQHVVCSMQVHGATCSGTQQLLLSGIAQASHMLSAAAPASNCTLLANQQLGAPLLPSPSAHLPPALPLHLLSTHPSLPLIPSPLFSSPHLIHIQDVPVCLSKQTRLEHGLALLQA